MKMALHRASEKKKGYANKILVFEIDVKTTLRSLISKGV
jgi:hypothetical protein